MSTGIPRGPPGRERRARPHAGRARARLAVLSLFWTCVGGASLPAVARPAVNETLATTYVAEVVRGPIHTVAEEYPRAFNPELIDLPTAELVARDHPVLTVSYLERRHSSSVYPRIGRGRQSGELIEFKARLTRDFMVGLHAPFLTQKLTRTNRTRIATPGTLTGLGIDVRYQIPWEVIGFRAAIGVRTPSLTTRDEPFLTPDDWLRLNGAYITMSQTVNLRDRYHFALLYVPMPQPPGIRMTTMFVPGLAWESTIANRRNVNFVRWTTEVMAFSFDRDTLGAFGPIRNAQLVVNTGLRIRSGILEIDLMARRLNTAGAGDVRLAMSRQF